MVIDAAGNTLLNGKGKSYTSVIYRVETACFMIFYVSLRSQPVAYPEIFFGGGQQTQLTEGRENRDLGAVVP
jgi:hypothetical protein